MWGVLFLAAACATDPATDFRLNLNPFVLYEFLDASASGNYFLSSARDIAAHPAIRFGDLILNSNRTLWLQGASGVSLSSTESSLSLLSSSALVSANTFQTSWLPLFQAGFVVELWAQSNNWEDNGDLFSLSRANTRAGTTSDNLVCNVSEPLFIFRNQGPSAEIEFQYARQPSNTRQQCVYNEASELRPPADTLAFFVKVLPNSPSLSLYALRGQEPVGRAEVHPFVGSVLGWDKNSSISSNLRFLHKNRYSSFEYNLLSFAIYPLLSDETIFSLAATGLPNARPYAKSFRRAVPENKGGFIRFCVNNASAARDSDCLDYANTWQTSPIMTLVNSSKLKVFITSLPQEGTLFYQSNQLAVSDLPFLVRNNVIEFRPPLNRVSWWVAGWTSARGYEWAKNDLANFQYIVQDSQGANSTPATVSIEVFPQHSAPIASEVIRSDVFAGKPMNTIELAPHNSDGTPVVTEFLRPSASAESCAGAVLLVCINQKDRANLAYATIKSLPNIGTLYTRIEGEYVPAQVGTMFFPSVGSCEPPCVPSIFAFYNSTLRSDYNEPVFFTYTVTTRFEGLQLNSTRYDVDDTPFVGPEPVIFIPLVESNQAEVRLNVRDGLYAVEGSSIVKQTTATQLIVLSAEDVTSSRSSLVLLVTSLPSRGTLFQTSGKAITPADLPAVVSGNMSLLYLPNITQSVSYSDGFTFVARSAQRQSPPASQTIQVVDVNDAPVILLPLNRLQFSRVGNPQTWESVGAANELFINFTDPDPHVASEPFYRVILSSVGDFSIFMSEDSWMALRPRYVGSLLIGALTGASGPGAGTGTWDFVATRQLALQVLNPVRIRPNKITTSAPLTITVQDAVFAPGFTDPRFSGPDWTSLSNTVTVTLAGDYGAESERTYLGVADMRVVYTIYGVIAFVALLICIICIFCAKCLYRKFRPHPPPPTQTAPLPQETEVLLHEERPLPSRIEAVRIHRPPATSSSRDTS